MQDVFEAAVCDVDYGYGPTIKLPRFHEWAQLVHLTLVKEAAATDGLGWVYVKHRSFVPDTTVRPQRVRVRTWLSQLTGNTSSREYTIHDETDGVLLFQRATTSVALELDTLKPATRDLSHLRRLIGGESLGIAPMAVELGPDSETYTVERTIEPDDIDHNRHVNNNAYIRWTHDAILRRAFEREGRLSAPKRVRDFQIRFLRPARLGARAVLKCSIEERAPGESDWKIEMMCDGGERPAAIAFASVVG